MELHSLSGAGGGDGSFLLDGIGALGRVRLFVEKELGCSREREN